MKKVLIFGNDKSLLSISEKDIPRDVITVGINRSYLHIKTDYLTFVDTEILMEMQKNNVDIRSLNCICPNKILEKHDANYTIAKKLILNNKILLRQCRVSRGCFSTIAMVIDIFGQKLGRCEYYLFACSMKYDPTQNHFWTGIHDTLNKNDKKWYDKRFPMMCGEIFRLRSSEFSIFSSTKDSLLNTKLKYVPINEINR